MARDRQRVGVAEFQGFYGPFTVTEKLLQKIWLRGDFNSAGAESVDGEEVEVLFPGKWNRLEGPDFREARLRIGGELITGDVELHFRVGDWEKHGHDRDENYNNVVLHVVLFPPVSGERPAVLLNGRRPPVLSLLGLLHHDLEEYAAEDAIEATLALTHWQATEQLLGMPPEERREVLCGFGRRRWEQKVYFARLRVEKLGWEEACHQTALEILGFRRNRGAMLTLGTRFPLERWRVDPPDEEELLESVRWLVRGSRPANHPRQRLRQYQQIVEHFPDWPGRLRDRIGGCGLKPGSDLVNGTRVARAVLGIKELRESWSAEIVGGFVGGTRLETLFCDGFFPLVAAAAPAGEPDLFPVWFSWYAGDFPDLVRETLKRASITDRREFVGCNGYCQGVIGLSLERTNDPLVCFEGGGSGSGEE